MVNKIPSHWEENRLASIGAFSKGRGISRKDLKEEGIPAILYGDIYTKYEIQASEIVNFIDGETADRAVKIKKGDILFTGSGETIEDIGKSISYEGDEIVYVGGDVIILSQQSPLYNSLFLSYSLSSSSSVFQKSTSSKGTIILHIYSSRLKNILLAIPPPPEQTAIATYLDRQTVLIDQKIALLSQKIDRYQELKKSLINETVCRGLNPTVPMKDSGVEWIGEVPEHWEVKRVKDIGNLVLGKMLSRKEASGMYLKKYLKSRNVKWLGIDTENIDEMYFTEDEMKSYRLKMNDLVFSEGGEVGKTAIWKNEIDECYIQNSVLKLTVNENQVPKYHLYFSFFLGKVGFYDSAVNQVSIKHLTKEKLIKVIWLSPPQEEQKEIGKYLDEKTAKIESIVSNLTNQITTLKELRKTLINDVVTGKVKVPILS